MIKINTFTYSSKELSWSSKYFSLRFWQPKIGCISNPKSLFIVLLLQIYRESSTHRWTLNLNVWLLHLPHPKENIAVDSPYWQLKKKNKPLPNARKSVTKYSPNSQQRFLQKERIPESVLNMILPTNSRWRGWRKATTAWLQPDLPPAGSCLWVNQPVVVCAFCRAHGFALGASQRSAAAAGTLPVWSLLSACSLQQLFSEQRELKWNALVKNERQSVARSARCILQAWYGSWGRPIRCLFKRAMLWFTVGFFVFKYSHAFCSRSGLHSSQCLGLCCKDYSAFS